MVIKPSVVNTFERVGIPYQSILNDYPVELPVKAYNRFTGEEVTTIPLVKYLIDWVYRISDAYEAGRKPVNISDFDRIRYFILDLDQKAYMTCID